MHATKFAFPSTLNHEVPEQLSPQWSGRAHACPLACGSRRHRLPVAVRPRPAHEPHPPSWWPARKKQKRRSLPFCRYRELPRRDPSRTCVDRALRRSQIARLVRARTSSHRRHHLLNTLGVGASAARPPRHRLDRSNAPPDIVSSTIGARHAHHLPDFERDPRAIGSGRRPRARVCRSGWAGRRPALIATSRSSTSSPGWNDLEGCRAGLSRGGATTANSAARSV